MHGGDIYRNNVNYDFSVNINPNGVPDEVKWVLSEAALHVSKYPDLLHENLISRLATIHNISDDTIVIGNGASEIIMAVIHHVQPKKAIVTAPAFSGYAVALKGAAPECEIIYHELQRREILS